MHNLHPVTQYFIENPKRLEKSTGKYIRGEVGPRQIFSGLSEADIKKYKQEAREFLKKAKEIPNEEKTIVENTKSSFVENVKEGTAELVKELAVEIHNLEELVAHCKIDTEKWEIVKYVQNYWGNSDNPHWQVKAWLSKKKEENLFQINFIKFLETYKVYQNPVIPNPPSIKPNACLIFNKQDAHYDKYDIYGDNCIDRRFGKVLLNTMNILDKCTITNNLEKVIYIIGSDEFNSEWTNATTKGTPQTNNLPYEEAFTRICNHEVGVLNLLLSKAQEVEVHYVPGNHDHYVGWHLISWLSCYFREQKNLKFNTSTDCTKYVRYRNSALMFNHGDDIKPEKLAVMFPMGFKDNWSECDNFYIFCGDKHHLLAKDLGGIQFYQIPALSNAKSKWDDKKGHLYTKGEMTCFLIQDNVGMTEMIKRPM